MNRNITRQPDAIAALPRAGTFKTLQLNYFPSPAQSLASLICLVLITITVWSLIKWGVVNAVWSGTPETCRAAAGACWAVITDRYRLIFFGLYPYDEQWRSAFGCAAILLTVVLSCIPRFWTVLRLTTLWVVGYSLFYVLMKGGLFDLPVVRERQWGGLALTLFVFASTVIIGMPMAIVLALLRKSRLPVIAKATALWIDGIRALPLLAIVFTCAIVLPLAMPDFMMGDQLYRVVFGFAIFYSVYQAEIIRSGIKALAAGQEEAAQALGLNYWQVTSRVVLPQAFRHSLPPTINQVVITFMETSLIVVIGFFEVTASANAAFSSGGWNATYVEVYTFVAFIYFIFTFSLSRYGAYLEKSLSIATR